MRVDRRAALAVGNAPHGRGIAYLGIHHVLPTQHAARLARAGDVHPRRHLRHRAAIDHVRAVESRDLVAYAGNRRARLAGEEHDLQPEIARIEPLLGRDLPKVERIGRRAVECRRLDHGEPLRAARRHSGHARAEWKALRAQALRARERAPASQVEREDGGDADRIARPQAHAPQHAGMSVGDRAPVAAPDGERGRPAGGAAGAVDVEDLAVGHAQIVAERGHALLRGAQILLLHHRNLLEILERLQPARIEAGLVPFASVERRVFIGVGADLLQSYKNGALALGRGHGLAARKPIAAVTGRKVALVVSGGKGPGFHRGSQRAPRSATSLRSMSTMACGGVSCSMTSFTPISLSATTSSSGITPPATTMMSSAPSARSLSKIFGNTAICTPDKRLTPRMSTSSWIAAVSTSSGVRCKPV